MIQSWSFEGCKIGYDLDKSVADFSVFFIIFFAAIFGAKSENKTKMYFGHGIVPNFEGCYYYKYRPCIICKP